MVPQPNQYTNKDKVETTIDEEKDEQTTTVKHALAPSTKYNKIIPSEEEHKAKIQEKNNTQQQQPHIDKKTHTTTLIHENLSQKAFEKKGIPYTPTPDEDNLLVFERRTKGQWTRKVTSITWYRDLEDKEFLDWNELREGNTDMKRKITEPANHVGTLRDPVPSERVEYNPDTEENQVVVDDRPKEVLTAYHVPFSKNDLTILIGDSNPRTCEYIVAQAGARSYNVSKKEMEKYAGDFDTIYSLKSDPAFKPGDKK